jgi:hypothetical protein
MPINPQHCSLLRITPRRRHSRLLLTAVNKLNWIGSMIGIVSVLAVPQFGHGMQAQAQGGRLLRFLLLCHMPCPLIQAARSKRE